jgi:hypothetical protein
MKFLSDFRLLLVGLWLGAACFFSFAVAPSAFAVLESREMAGSVVNRTLAIINYSGLIIGVILLASSFISKETTNRAWLWTERFLLLILTAACAVGQFVIALWLSVIRSQIGRPVEEVALDDALRVQFNTWHQYSIWVLVGAMIAALLVFFIISRKSFINPKEKVSKDFDFQNEFKV